MLHSPTYFFTVQVLMFCSFNAEYLSFSIHDCISIEFLWPSYYKLYGCELCCYCPLAVTKKETIVKDIEGLFIWGLPILKHAVAITYHLSHRLGVDAHTLVISPGIRLFALSSASTYFKT